MGVAVPAGPIREPCFMAGSAWRTVVAETAKPNPSTEVPDPDSLMTSVLMPTTSPMSVKRGPPLLPGLMGASVCTSQRPLAASKWTRETTPLVTDAWLIPSG